MAGCLSDSFFQTLRQDWFLSTLGAYGFRDQLGVFRLSLRQIRRLSNFLKSAAFELKEGDALNW